MAKYLFLFSLYISYSLVNAACPWTNATLEKWSTGELFLTINKSLIFIVSAWNVANAAVFIGAGRSVLLDTTPPALASLNISGTLVFDNAVTNIHILVFYALEHKPHLKLDFGKLWRQSDPW